MAAGWLDEEEPGLDYRRAVEAYQAMANGRVGRSYEQDHCRAQADRAERIAVQQEARR